MIGGLTEGGAVGSDPDDAGGQTLLVAYPTLYPGGDASYVPPRVKIEAGARSALAARALLDMGFRDVAHLEGGFKAWKDAGAKVEDTSATSRWVRREKN